MSILTIPTVLLILKKTLWGIKFSKKKSFNPKHKRQKLKIQ